jgi:hypothetical protein
VSAVLAVATLSRDEARSLTDEVKGNAERLWRKLVELYEGDAHKTLGYSSWGAYFKTEFGGSRSRAYELLDAGRVASALQSGIPDSPMPNAGQAVELRSLKNDPPALREAWAEVIERHPEPTAADVREVVAERLPAMSNKATMNANAEVRRVHKALSSIEGFCTGLSGVRIDRVLSVAKADDLGAWKKQVARVISELNLFQRSLKEEG